MSLVAVSIFQVVLYPVSGTASSATYPVSGTAYPASSTTLHAEEWGAKRLLFAFLCRASAADSVLAVTEPVPQRLRQLR